MGPKDSQRAPNPLQRPDGAGQPLMEVSIASRSTQASAKTRFRLAGSPWSRASISRLVTNANSLETQTVVHPSTMPSEWSGVMEAATGVNEAVAEAAKDEPFVALQLPEAYAEKLQSLSSGNPASE
jgi:hypothetical protein